MASLGQTILWHQVFIWSNAGQELIFLMASNLLKSSAWWRHNMETLSALLSLLGNAQVIGRFHSETAIKVELWCFL